MISFRVPSLIVTLSTLGYSGSFLTFRYPAGFVYLFSLLYQLTGGGTLIRHAQYIFMFLYLLQLALVLCIYSRTRQVRILIELPLLKLCYSIFSMLR